MSEPSAPTAEQIRSAREAANLTYGQAAALVHALERSWRHWEKGTHKMPLGLWELFTLKAAQRAGDGA
jgi:DNA-binding transcriptional regulator YiaG